MFKPELLAPAGDPEKLLFAYRYGADAAYIGAGAYSLRLNSGFSLEQISEAVSLARRLDKKLYLALNAYMRDQFLFYGIPTPQRRALIRPLLRAEKQAGRIDWALLDLCYSDPHREKII